MLLRVVRKIAKKKDKCEKQAIDNEFAIELDKDCLLYTSDAPQDCRNAQRKIMHCMMCISQHECKHS